MGEAEKWQKRVLKEFDRKPTEPMIRKRIKKLLGKDFAKTYHEMDVIRIALSASVRAKKGGWDFPSRSKGSFCNE